MYIAVFKVSPHTQSTSTTWMPEELLSIHDDGGDDGDDDDDGGDVTHDCDGDETVRCEMTHAHVMVMLLLQLNHFLCWSWYRISKC